MKPTIERIKELFEYIETPEALRWKVRRPHCQDKKVGCLRPDGYVRVRIDRAHVFAHHIVWVLHHGEWPTDQLDHKNCIRSDNRIGNLRTATRTQNQANRKISKRNTTGFKGVSQCPSGRYSAMIQVFGKTEYLGTFDTAEEAHTAYKYAATRLHGEFARPS